MTENEILELAMMNGIKIDPALFKDWKIRMKAYRRLGFTEKAFDDKCSEVRREAYWALGFTEKAFDDEHWNIRREAKQYFELKNKIKTREAAQATIDVWKLERL